MIIPGTRIEIPELHTHREVIKTAQNSFETGCFFPECSPVFKNYKTSKTVTILHLEKEASVYKNKHAFVLRVERGLYSSMFFSSSTIEQKKKVPVYLTG